MMPDVDGLTVCRVLRSRGRPHPDPDAHRPHRDLRPGGRPRRRRRRLPAQAVRPRRAAGPAAGPAAADPARRRPGRGRTGRCRSPTCASTRRPAGAGGATRSSSCPRPSSTCSSCWCATPASCSTTPRIYERIWGYDFGPDSKNLAVYISYLRRKIDDGHDAQADPHRARRGLHGARASTVSLRLKLVLALVALAAAATAAIGAVQLPRPPRRSSRARSTGRWMTRSRRLGERPGDRDGVPGARPRSGGGFRGDGLTSCVQLIDAGRHQPWATGGVDLPVDAADRRHRGRRTSRCSAYRDVEVDDEPYRMLTVGYGGRPGRGAGGPRAWRRPSRCSTALRTRILVAAARGHGGRGAARAGSSPARSPAGWSASPAPPRRWPPPGASTWRCR